MKGKGIVRNGFIISGSSVPIRGFLLIDSD